MKKVIAEPVAGHGQIGSTKLKHKKQAVWKTSMEQACISVAGVFGAETHQSTMIL